jgi:hypothetical protein
MNSSLIPHTSDASPTAAVPNKRHQVGITTLGFPTRLVMHLPLVVPICRRMGWQDIIWHSPHLGLNHTFRNFDP